MFASEGLEHGMTLEEVGMLQRSFASGYAREFNIPQDAAARFFDLYHSLDTIANVAEDIAKGVPINKESLGILIGQCMATLEKAAVMSKK